MDAFLFIEVIVAGMANLSYMTCESVSRVKNNT